MSQEYGSSLSGDIKNFRFDPRWLYEPGKNMIEFMGYLE